MNRLIKKFSIFFLKLHMFLEKKLTPAPKTTFQPYIIKAKTSEGRILPKVIHINGNFDVGGTTQLIVDLIENTSDKFFHTVIVPKIPDPVPYTPLNIKEYSIHQLFQLYEYIKSENPAFVHIHYWTRPNHRYESWSLWYYAAFKICEELGIKVIQNINVPTFPYISTSVVHNVYVSKYVLDEFGHTMDISSSVIYPGSDFSHFSNKDPEHLPDDCIGMVYRLDPDKLNETAIEIFIEVVKKRPKTICYIVGTGYYYEYYKKRVTEEQLDQNFIFTGMVSYKDLPGYYKKFCIFITPVHDESFGQVTPFAMSIGLAVAGFQTGALPEILGGTETLVPYGRIDLLSDIVVDLLNNKTRRLEIVKNNQSRAHGFFSKEKMIQDYLELYKKVLEIPRG